MDCMNKIKMRFQSERKTIIFPVLFYLPTFVNSRMEQAGVMSIWSWMKYRLSMVLLQIEEMLGLDFKLSMLLFSNLSIRVCE